jgi:hypothetical protein
MARVSKEAIQILAKKISDAVDKKKEVAIPSKIAKLIENYTTISNEQKELNAKLNALSTQLSNLGYYNSSFYSNGTSVYTWKPRQIPVTTYNQIYDDIVLALEFDKKDLASLEKELLLKYSK